MKISTKGRYGLTVIVELGRKFGEGPVPLRKIAEEQNLSEAYLEQLIPPLRNSGLVKSVRGAYGGYKLAKDPSQITAGEIIRLLEGPIQLVEGLEDDEIPQRELWKRIGDAIRGVLDHTTIKDLIEYEDTPTQDEYMFYI
ncbi:Rrf2 family transcriptional regulator [Mammaliicoccus sciuri]|uniref:Transcriptional regulator, BadM/Rrf2 family n=2 Tax=Sporosarcina newyorkensis TaxID=759851 RepID=A0A1T4XEC8_9BACL|nr:MULTISPECIES: Rrf2 family transcriptional regulator [Sporosarcina]EGQ27627.1 iron-sulfur cluster assembly transcription regulator IscR [Sporosarcina newyorkensis 2681]MBY0221008.1 Rrf2 family transcriptional regulator [Sporosarcina aquimarina]SKA87890.1 transcriptional regulator, BadM/Rrf2 family [Sporosarcina newyorkensis]